MVSKVGILLLLHASAVTAYTQVHLCSMSSSFSSLQAEGTNRRSFVENIASATTASLITLTSSGASAEPEEKMAILITGANSGVGFDAARKLSALGHDVYVACRTASKASETASMVGAKGSFECDLSSLSSVKNFAKAWGSKPIDVLCLNAGMAPSTKGGIQRTAEGFEMAVGTNHLGHFLLANLLLKNLETSQFSAPRLVVTASSVHDPDSPGGNVGSKATLGDLKGLVAYAEGSKSFDMVDGETYDGDKAYKDSKLCNVLFTLELERRLRLKNSKIHAYCFSPGLIPSSGLFRNQNPLFAKLFGFVAQNILGVASTVSQGGDTLLYMATSRELEGKGGLFLATDPGKPRSQFRPRPPSREAQDENKARRLWELSEKVTAL